MGDTEFAKLTLIALTQLMKRIRDKDFSRPTLDERYLYGMLIDEAGVRAKKDTQ